MSYISIDLIKKAIVSYQDGFQDVDPFFVNVKTGRAVTYSRQTQKKYVFSTKTAICIPKSTKAQQTLKKIEDALDRPKKIAKLRRKISELQAEIAKLEK